jgi:hypothetical protein
MEATLDLWHIIWAGSLHFLHLLLVFSYRTCQPIQLPFPLACMNSLNFYKWPPLRLCLCLYSHTANSLLFPTVGCVFAMTQKQYAIFAILFGTFLISYEKYSWLWHCTTTREIPDSISSRVLGNFTATYSFCLHSLALRSNQPNINEYLGISLGLKWGQCIELTTLSS